MKNIKTLFIFIFLGVVVFFFLGCFFYSDSEHVGSIYGTISYTSSNQDSSAYYVILDDDNDVTNGYIKRQIINTATYKTSVNYEIDTTDVSAGSYFLLGGWDFGSGNMDPSNPSVWEAKAWYGGVGTNPPALSNITDLNGNYNIILTGLN